MTSSPAEIGVCARTVILAPERDSVLMLKRKEETQSEMVNT